MNNISKLLLGAAALGLWACSNDEPANAPETKPVEGDVAYLNVNILAGDASSRGGSQIDDKDFIYGDGNENKVNNAYFYFYDEKGNFVSEANSWTTEETGKEENVEKLGKGTVILKGLTGKDYPTWVVTVLNKPEDLTAQRTIEAMAKEVMQSTYGKGDDMSFVMSTSSYFGEGTENSPYYFATKLSPENFLQEYPEENKEEFTDAERVDIYVERLAARVQVSANKLKATTLDNGKEGYALDVTVAGKPNADEVDKVTDGIAAEKVYIVFEGWGLNATALETTLSKSLEGWNAQTAFAGDWAYAKAWNHADYHRSYWGKSTVYGISDDDELAAKLHVGENYFTDLNQVVGTPRLNGTRLYCNENTNEVENITDGNLPMPNKTTTVLLAARVCDAGGNPLDLVNYLGINYLKGAFMNKVFDITNPQYYSRELKETIEVNGQTIELYDYKQIDPAGCELVSAGNGTGTVDVNVAAANDTVYYRLGNPQTITVPANDETDEDGYTATIYPNATAVAKTVINSTLMNATAGESNYAVAYTGGATVYSIPLEHLNNANDENAKVEGQWGTVRNHIYSLDIKKISSLGDGVFKPYGKEEGGELINPNKPKNPLYYVESNINILSWKIVTQEADI